MEGARAASGEDQDGAEFPMEPLGSRVPELEQPQVPAEERRPESPESSPSVAPAVKEEAGAGQDLSGGKKLPSPRPGPLRLLPSSPGYSAFRRQESASPELPSPGPAAAEQPRDGETPGAEQMLRAAPGEPARGAWAPMELQVDVRVKSVGAAGSSCAPSPAPSTRFLTVPVPESPAFSHHASPAHPLLRLTPSPGGTWGRGTPLAAARTERDLDAEGWAGPAEGRAESPGSPTCRCRCKEDAVLHAEMDGDKKLSRVIKLVELSRSLLVCAASLRSRGGRNSRRGEVFQDHVTAVAARQHRGLPTPCFGSPISRRSRLLFSLSYIEDQLTPNTHPFSSYCCYCVGTSGQTVLGCV
nr:killer cell lectin-like receptor subfamily G member 2 isoform X6 [Globicephala melas]